MRNGGRPACPLTGGRASASSGQANPRSPRDRFRSLILDQLLPVLRIPGVRFHSLQKGPAESQLADLPADVEVAALGAAFDDLEDLVAAIGAMDLVISVCTGPAHIAGAMGKPVWTLISEPPDLRWLTGREDSPWYPTMRLFRQRVPGCWDDVVERVAGELARGPAAWEQPRGRARRARPRPCADRGAARRVDEDAIDAGMAQLAETRQGLLMFDPGEAFAGPSIERYGEWLHGQLELALRLLAPGSVVVEAGAGVGARTRSRSDVRSGRTACSSCTRVAPRFAACCARTSSRTTSPTPC